MVAVVGVDPELTNDFETVLAPVGDVDEGVVERCAIFARETVAIAQRVGGREDIRSDDFVEQMLELTVCELHLIVRLEFLSEVPLKRCTITNVRAVLVLQAAKLVEKFRLEFSFIRRHHNPLSDVVRKDSGHVTSRKKDLYFATRPAGPECAFRPSVPETGTAGGDHSSLK